MICNTLIGVEKPLDLDRPVWTHLLSIEDALDFIAYEDIFWVMT